MQYVQKDRVHSLLSGLLLHLLWLVIDGISFWFFIAMLRREISYLRKWKGYKEKIQGRRCAMFLFLLFRYSNELCEAILKKNVISGSTKIPILRFNEKSYNWQKNRKISYCPIAISEWLYIYEVSTVIFFEPPGTKCQCLILMRYNICWCFLYKIPPI